MLMEGNPCWRTSRVGWLVVLATCGPSTPSTTTNTPSESTGSTAAKGSNMTPARCEEARDAIAARRFIAWRGLPPGCTSEALFGVPLDDSWGALPLGESHERARSRLLDLTGYYRPLAYARDGHIVAFDAMNPQLASTLQELEDSLGAPDTVLDSVFGTVPMPGAERVYAGRGITLFINPSNQVLLHVTVYAPTTADVYQQKLRPPREKRPHGPAKP
jgi:hypothetical protein